MFRLSHLERTWGLFLLLSLPVMRCSSSTLAARKAVVLDGPQWEGQLATDCVRGRGVSRGGSGLQHCLLASFRVPVELRRGLNDVRSLLWTCGKV